MKRFSMIALVLVLTVCLLTGCFGRNKNDNTSVPSTAPTTNVTTQPTSRPATQPTTQPDGTMPSMDDMIPGTEDTIDPTNGANQDTGAAKGRTMPPRY